MNRPYFQISESATCHVIIIVPKPVPAPSESTSAATKTKEQLWRCYVRMLQKVVDESDVILLVLDTRDPGGW